MPLNEGTWTVWDITMARKRTESNERPKKLPESKVPEADIPKRRSRGAKKSNLCQDCSELGRTKRRNIDVDKIINRYRRRIPFERLREWNLDATLIIPDLCPQCGSPLGETSFVLEIQYPALDAPVRLALGCPTDLDMIRFLLGGKGFNYRLFRALWDDRLMEFFGVTDEAALKDAVNRLLSS